MAIRGSLREASLPDVLQLLSMGRKTGCLSLAHKQAFGSIYFDRGRIAFASIVNRRDRLGDLLVTNGQLTRDELERAISVQAETPDRRLGDILIALELLSREELHQHIKRQIEEAVYHLFTWTQGTFSFEPDVNADEQDFVVSINPESLLLEGARRVDEWSLIEKKVPGFDSIFSLDRGHLASAAVDLTAEQEVLVPLLDGIRDVQALIDASGLGEFEVGKALFGLATAGFIHRVGKRQLVEPSSVDSRVAEHRNLGVAFYKSAMFDEATREFRRALELRPEDDISEFHLGLCAMRDARYEEAIGLFRALVVRGPRRATAQANLSLALECLGRPHEAREAARAAQSLAPRHPGVCLHLAGLLVRNGELAEARTLLAAVRGAEGRKLPVVWFHQASLAAALDGDLDEAIDIATAGLAAWPAAAPLANNLAAMLERAGREPEAMALIERALVDGPGIPQLHKNAGDLHQSAGEDAEALESLARAVRLDPDLGPAAWHQLGTLRSARGERDDAARCWQRSRVLEQQRGAAPAGVASAGT
jgi:tetratricopeptide (TPR) repeat protein